MMILSLKTLYLRIYLALYSLWCIVHTQSSPPTPYLSPHHPSYHPHRHEFTITVAYHITAAAAEPMINASITTPPPGIHRHRVYSETSFEHCLKEWLNNDFTGFLQFSGKQEFSRSNESCLFVPHIALQVFADLQEILMTSFWEKSQKPWFLSEFEGFLDFKRNKKGKLKIGLCGCRDIISI